MFVTVTCSMVSSICISALDLPALRMLEFRGEGSWSNESVVTSILAPVTFLCCSTSLHKPATQFMFDNVSLPFLLMAVLSGIPLTALSGALLAALRSWRAVSSPIILCATPAALATAV